jgi:hypothetical protein
VSAGAVVAQVINVRDPDSIRGVDLAAGQLGAQTMLVLNKISQSVRSHIVCSLNDGRIRVCGKVSTNKNSDSRVRGSGGGSVVSWMRYWTQGDVKGPLELHIVVLCCITIAGA